MRPALDRAPLAVVAFAVALFAGALLYFSIERPFLLLRDRLFDKRKADVDYALATKTG